MDEIDAIGMSVCSVHTCVWCVCMRACVLVSPGILSDLVVHMYSDKYNSSWLIHHNVLPYICHFDQP